MFKLTGSYQQTFKKHFFMLLFVVLVGNNVFSQDTLLLRNHMNQLHEALLKKDIGTLQQLLHPELSYGHSNGWVQNSTEMSADLVSGKIVYKKLDATAGIIALQKNIAQVRCENDVEGTVNGNAFAMKLHVLQVWIWENNNWRLYARQSTKL